MRLVTDPVCGMKVDPAVSPTRVGVDRRAYYFCSAVCVEQFGTEPVLRASPAPTRVARRRAQSAGGGDHVHDNASR